MGLQQPNRELCHAWAVAGEALLTCSEGLASTVLSRCFQSSMSWLSIGPDEAGCCAVWEYAGAAIFNVCVGP